MTDTQINNRRPAYIPANDNTLSDAVIDQLRVNLKAVHFPTAHKYRLGDRVYFAIPNAQALGYIVSTDASRYCITCHCTPINLAHHGADSMCCPGPWYRVVFMCSGCGGTTHDHADQTIAEHELTSAGY